MTLEHYGAIAVPLFERDSWARSKFLLHYITALRGYLKNLKSVNANSDDL